MKLVWMDPPARNARPDRKWAEIGDALRRNRGRWARILTDVSSGYAALINQGKIAGLGGAGFEATTRSGGLDYKRGNADIYARYVGEDSAE